MPDATAADVRLLIAEWEQAAGSARSTGESADDCGEGGESWPVTAN